MLNGLEISKCVKEMAIEKPTKQMAYFMQKYNMSYEECSYLNYAALVVSGYNSQFKVARKRLYYLSESVAQAVTLLNRVKSIRSKEMRDAVDILTNALNIVSATNEGQINDIGGNEDVEG